MITCCTYTLVTNRFCQRPVHSWEILYTYSIVNPCVSSECQATRLGKGVFLLVYKSQEDCWCCRLLSDRFVLQTRILEGRDDYRGKSKSKIGEQRRREGFYTNSSMSWIILRWLTRGSHSLPFAITFSQVNANKRSLRPHCNLSVWIVFIKLYR